jgi:hypothetical protein
MSNTILCSLVKYCHNLYTDKDNNPLTMLCLDHGTLDKMQCEAYYLLLFFYKHILINWIIMKVGKGIMEKRHMNNARNFVSISTFLCLTSYNTLYLS